MNNKSAWRADPRAFGGTGISIFLSLGFFKGYVNLGHSAPIYDNFTLIYTLGARRAAHTAWQSDGRTHPYARAPRVRRQRLVHSCTAADRAATAAITETPIH